ncbi:MAG: hypothetical protein AB7I41_11660 [Candidatus Sericytochromatia bacterium]
MTESRFQLLEKDKRLSESKLWQMLENYYQHAGLDAWLQLPFYATSNAFIAEQYAELVVAFLLDLAPDLNPQEPVYILELAAGSGYFGFLCLQALQRRLRCFSALNPFSVVYVMTDFSEKNLKAWEQSPQLAPYAQAGQLDFALFKPESQAKFKLKRAGRVVKAGSLANPLIAFANYFFDSIRQDYFQIENGEIQEALVSLVHELKPDLNRPKSPPSFAQIHVNERYIPLKEPRYAEARWNQLLESYRTEAPELSLLFPIGALMVLTQLEKISPAGLMLISTDKGFHDPAYLQGLRPVPFTPHSGVFSYMVNYHALARYFRQAGGLAQGTQEYYSLTSLVGMAPLAKSNPLPQTHYCLQERFVRQNPIKSLFILLELFKSKDLLAGVEIKERYLMAMAAIQTACFDIYYFLVLAPHLAEALTGLGPDYLEDDLPGLLKQVETRLYDLVAGFDSAYEWLRHLYYELGQLDDSLRLNARILARSGPDFKTAYYAAAVAELQGRFGEALQGYTQALLHNPQDEMAQAGLQRMVAKIGA